MKSKFYKWSKNGNKMIINSGYKKFDKQTNYISSGNVLGNTIYSNYIRNYNKTDCNGNIFEKGHLFNYDLKFFNISSEYKEYIRALDLESIILYEIFIYNNHQKEILGWILEDASIKKVIDVSINYEYKKNISKRRLALKTVQNIIEEKRGV